MNPGRGQKKCSNCQSIIGVRSKKCPSCNFEFEPSKSGGKVSASAPSSSKNFLNLLDDDDNAQKILSNDIIDTDFLGEESPRFEVPLTKIWSFGPAGRGQKKCASCGALNGVRAHDCGNCEHTFEIKRNNEDIESDSNSTATSKNIEKDLGYYIVPGGIPYDPKKEIILTPSGNPPIPIPDDIGGEGYVNVIEWGKRIVENAECHYTSNALAFWCNKMPICDPKNMDWLFYREQISKALATVPGVIVMKEKTK